MKLDIVAIYVCFSLDGDVITPLKDEKPHPLKRRMSRRISYMMTTSGTGQPQLNYPHINFQPCAFFALGSPIGKSLCFNFT